MIIICFASRNLYIKRYGQKIFYRALASCLPFGYGPDLPREKCMETLLFSNAANAARVKHCRWCHLANAGTVVYTIAIVIL